MGSGRPVYDRGVLAQQPFVSHARNNEDVVLWRALAGVVAGRYVEVGAHHPTGDSATRALYDRGWTGLAVVPDAGAADLHRTERPQDQVVEVAPRTADEARPDLPLIELVEASGWTTGEDVHVLVMRVTAPGRAAVTGTGLVRLRPWVLVVQAGTTTPAGSRPVWEPGILDAGYELCLFDGRSHFYVAAEHADELRVALSYPACTDDGFRPLALTTAERDLAEVRAQVVHWRAIALTAWADALEEAYGRSARGDAEAEQLRQELDAIQRTLSWRVTRPLRSVKSMVARVRQR